MNKNRENFKKYSNDLYFHHLLVENERIRTLIRQELVSDRKIISIKLKKAIEEYIKYYEGGNKNDANSIISSHKKRLISVDMKPYSAVYFILK